jgi:hypothetical protein
MALKGDAKTAYMREYMRRRRTSTQAAGKAAVVTAAKPLRDGQEVRELKAELGRTRELLAKAEAKLVGMPPVERASEVERLKTANRELRHKVKFLTETFDAKVNRLRSSMMPRELFAALVKATHADTRKQMTAKQWDEINGQLTQWKKGLDVSSNQSRSR